MQSVEKTRLYTKLSLCRRDQRDVMSNSLRAKCYYSWWSKSQRHNRKEIQKLPEKSSLDYLTPNQTHLYLCHSQRWFAELLSIPVLKAWNGIHCMTLWGNLSQCFTSLTMRKLFLMSIWNLPLCNLSLLLLIPSTTGMENKLAHSLFVYLRTLMFHFNVLSLE